MEQSCRPATSSREAADEPSLQGARMTKYLKSSLSLDICGFASEQSISPPYHRTVSTTQLSACLSHSVWGLGRTMKSLWLWLTPSSWEAEICYLWAFSATDPAGMVLLSASLRGGWDGQMPPCPSGHRQRTLPSGFPVCSPTLTPFLCPKQPVWADCDLG